jgi:hypothetical protein
MKYKKVRTLKDLNNDPRAYEAFREETGIWVNLKECFLVDGEEVAIHEPTIKEACRILNNLVTKK